MHSDEGYVLKALKSGAKGYLLKDSAEHDLINAVKTVSEGKAFFSPAISKMLVEDYVRQMHEQKVEDSYDLLTTREREVLQLLAEGRSNKEVATVARLEPAHGGDTSRSHHAEAEPPQRGGNDSLRNPEGRHHLDLQLLGEPPVLLRQLQGWPAGFTVPVARKPGFGALRSVRRAARERRNLRAAPLRSTGTGRRRPKVKSDNGSRSGLTSDETVNRQSEP